MVEVLLAKGADANHVTVDGWSALCYACQGGKLPVVEMLLDKGQAQVGIRTVKGATPLSIAAKNGFLSICTLLLEEGRGAQVNTKNCLGASPIWRAAENGHLEVTLLYSPFSCLSFLIVFLFRWLSYYISMVGFWMMWTTKAYPCSMQP